MLSSYPFLPITVNASVHMDVNLLLLFGRRRVLVGLVFGVVCSLLRFNCILEIET